MPRASRSLKPSVSSLELAAFRTAVLPLLVLRLTQGRLLRQ